MKVWWLGNCENFVSKREELVVGAFIDSEPMEKASDENYMAGLRSKRVLDLLETKYIET